ncbi:HNH endonuclease [Marinosulfonomonas sp. PRT-SC04]|nr:HNH endonuclease [Marinosulfonomonas sp. PRT-SC04]
MALQKICVAAGCDDMALPALSHCADHEAARQAKLKARRARAGQGDKARQHHRLYECRAWRKARKAHLSKHPLCVDCGEFGLVIAARDVDHIEPHEGDRKKFWDRRNWQSLCHPCHSRKTAREVLAGDRGCLKTNGP